ncbi:MAG: hypothetical protein Kilf2KO_34240 [Rhodospirillales bacterium]
MNDKRLFPSAWGWDKYEKAFLEAAERDAQVREALARASLYPIENEIAKRWSAYEGTKLLAWWDEQVLKGPLPDDAALMAKIDGEGALSYQVGLERGRAQAESSPSSAGADRNPPSGTLAPANGNVSPGWRRR